MGKIFENTEAEGATTTDGPISFLDKMDRLEGTLELAGTFRIESEVKGTVRCKKQLIVGEGARMQGEIEAAIVTVAGKINGIVRATDRVEILPSGILMGEVDTPRLIVHGGGILNGRSHMPVEGVAEEKGLLEMEQFMPQEEVSSEEQSASWAEVSSQPQKP